MKGIWKAIAYFVLYFGLTMILQALLSIVFCAIGAANGLNDETLIMEFVNNNILGMTVISGILTVLVLYLVFSAPREGCDVSRVEIPPDKVLATSSVTAYGSWK